MYLKRLLLPHGNLQRRIDRYLLSPSSSSAKAYKQGIFMIILLKKGCAIMRTPHSDEIVLPFGPLMMREADKSQVQTLNGNLVLYFECEPI